jgi:hypothetical protein
MLATMIGLATFRHAGPSAVTGMAQIAHPCASRQEDNGFISQRLLESEETIIEIC